MTSSHRPASAPATAAKPEESRSQSLTPLATAVVAALAPAGASMAQDSELAIEEIVVTASKRAVSMQDLGQSIEVFTTTDIERQAFKAMEDYVRALPSVTLFNSRPGRNSIIMRGISTGAEEYYTQSQVAVYLDEQPITTVSQQVDVRMVDINRVESLPGPQGTLYGSSSQAGTLRIITNQPDATAVSGQVDLTGSTTDGGDPGYDVSGWVNFPLIEDRLAIRAVAYTSKDGGYVDNVLGTTLEGSEDNASLVEENQNEYAVTGGRIAAKWLISDNWDLDLSYIAEESNLDGAWGSDPGVGDFKLTKFFKEYRDDTWYQAAATIKGDLGFAELVANASYFDRDIQYEWDNMVYEQWKDAYWGPYYALYDSDYTFGTTFNDQQVDRKALELRLASQGDSRFNWIIGGFYEESTNQWFYGARNPDYVGTTSWYAAQYYAYYYNYLGYDVAYPLPDTDIGYSETRKQTLTQKAVFGEVGYELIDNKWDVTFGARWFEFDNDDNYIQQFPQGLPPFGSFDTAGRYGAGGTESDTIFKVQTRVFLNDDIMAYGLYSEGYRMGGSNSPRAAATGFVPATYNPDKVENIEIGVKSTILDGSMQLNVIGFQMEWKDIQSSQSSVDGRWWLRGWINGGVGRNRGAEVSVNWQATDSFSLMARATFQDPKFIEDVVRITDTIPAGTPMVWAPERKYNLNMQYEFPDVLGGDLWLAWDYYWEDEKWSNEGFAASGDPTGLVPSWSMHNVHAGMYWENGWDVQLTVRNATNELAVNSLNHDTSGLLFGDPRFDNLRNYARPRTISVTLRKRFQ